MERGGTLFEDIVRVQLADRFLFNAYFVAARPSEPHIAPYPLNHRGVMEIFRDFFAHVNRRWPQPTIPLWLSAAVFGLGVIAWIVAVYRLKVWSAAIGLFFLAIFLGTVWALKRFRKLRFRTSK
jgi:hypothetical protein